MTTIVHDLVVSLVEDLFGPICCKTIHTILKHNRINMRDLIELAGFDRRTVNQALCVLIKHRFVKFEEPVVDSKRKPVVYIADIAHAVNLPFYPLFVNIVKVQHGNVAEIILEEILHQGCTTKHKVLETCLVRLQTTNTEKHLATHDNLDNVFEVLMSCNYIEKTEEVEDEERGEPPSKKMRGGETLWRVNVTTFMNYLRDKRVVEFIKNRFDDGAGEVVNVILTLNTQVEGDMSLMSSSASYDQILQGLKSKNPNLVPFARSYLDILVNSPIGIIKMVDEFNGGCYLVNFGCFYEEFSKHHISSIVRERFGPKCHRVFAIVIGKKMVEQKQVSELAMVPFKDAKELLYKLYTENFIQIQELHRTPDFSPLRTFYLFHVPVEKLRLKLLNTCYKAIYNLMCIRKNKLNENSRLVEKSLRADAAMLQAQQKGISPDDLEDMLTSSEKQQLGSCMRIVKKLDLGEINLVDTVLALTHFGNSAIS